MSPTTRDALVRSAEVAKLVLPLIAPSQITDIAIALIRTGLTWNEARETLAANNATPEQLEYFDHQNEFDVIEAIRAQGKTIA